MKGWNHWLLGALAAVLTTAGGAEAQIFTPTFLGPRASSDVGVYLSDGPGDLAVEGIWRRGFGGYDLGLRVGIADTDPDAAVLVGGELRSPLRLGGAPLDAALTGGVQAVIGDRDGLGAQLGLALGRTFAGAPFSISPYLHPRIAVVNALGEGDESDLELLADLGVDFGFSPNLVLRLGIAFEQPGAGLGVGLAWR